MEATNIIVPCQICRAKMNLHKSIIVPYVGDVCDKCIDQGLAYKLSVAIQNKLAKRQPKLLAA